MIKRFSRKRIVFVFAAVIIAIFLLSSCSGGGGERISEIKSVRYDREDAVISVDATLDSADVREFRGETVYLIEVPANSDISDIVTLIPQAQAKSAAEMNFKLPLKDGAKTMLYSGFVLAVFDRTHGYIPLCDVKYMENPQALAKNSQPYPSFSSIKGLSIVSSSDAVNLGVRHTVIRIPVEDYLLSESEDGAQSYVFDGNPYYFSGKKIAELDYKIKNLTLGGIEVFLEFTLDTAADALEGSISELASCSIPTENGEETDNVHYAISVDSGNAYRHMAAFFKLIAERYTRQDGKYGFAGAYIIGSGANSENDDPKTLGEKVSGYAKLLRIASSALRSEYENGKIFISLDGKWKSAAEEQEISSAVNEAVPVARRRVFGGEEYLKALKRELNSGGENDFGVAVMPVSGDIGEMNPDYDYIDMESLSLVRELIGVESELVIYNYGISAANETAMAAEYAYAYGKATEAGVTAFIYNGQWDDSTGNGKTGLWSTDGIGNVVKRQIYEVFRNIDVRNASLPDSVLAAMGSERASVLEKYEDRIKNADVSSNSGSTVKNEKDKRLKKAEEITLFDFSGGENYDFFPSDSASFVEIAGYLGVSALRSGLVPKYKGENVGVRSSPVPYEKLKNAFNITAVLSADPGEGNTALVTLALVQSGREGSVLHTSSVSVLGANRQTVYFDISDAELRQELGDVSLYIWVRSESGRSPVYSGGEADEQYLYIESITALASKGGGGFVKILIIILILAVVLVSLYMLFLRDRGKGSRRNIQRPRPLGQRPLNGRSPMGQQRPQANRPVSGNRPMGTQRRPVYPQNPASGQRPMNPQRRGNYRTPPGKR